MSVAMGTGMLIYQFEFVMPFEARIGTNGGKCHRTFSLHDIEYGGKVATT